MKNMVTIHTSRAPAPAGHYVQALQVDGIIYVSGILGISPEDKEIKVRDFEQQVQLCFENLKAILAAANADLNDVAKMTIYIDDIAKWDVANAIYAREFGAHKPARAIVPTRTLHHGFQIEIEAVAHPAAR